MYNNKICVCMLLDSESADIIEALQGSLDREKPSGHITVATYSNIDPSIVMEYTKEFCQNHSKIKIEYTGVAIGITRGENPLLFASPRVTTELLKMHFDFHQKYDDKCIGYTSLYPNEWTPHTSLGAYSAQAIEFCVENFKHIDGHLVGMKVVDVGDSEYKTLSKYEFEG